MGESLREFWTEIPVTLRCFTSKQRLLCWMWSTFYFIYRKRKSIYHPSSLIFDRRSFHCIHPWFHFFIIYLLWEKIIAPSSCLDASFKPGDLFKQSTVWTNSCVLISGSCPGKVCSGVAGSPLEDSSGVFLQRKYTLKIIMVKSFPCYN